MRKIRGFLFLMLLAAGATLAAAVKMPAIFSDHMVLQRNRKLKVWGWADEGEKITVTFKGASVSTVAVKGKWLVTLPEFPADKKGAEMVVSGTNRIVFKDVVVGDVWICSGQSNMAWRMDRTENAEKMIAKCADARIRLFYGNTTAISRVPQEDFPGKNLRWELCEPRTLPRFSGVGYYFGMNLAQSLDVPVGLISVNRGSSRIDAWTPPCGFAQRAALKSIYNFTARNIPGTPQYRKHTKMVMTGVDKWLTANRKNLAAGKPLEDMPFYLHKALEVKPAHPAVMFNTMINPIIRFGVRGAIWYQGCSNVNEGDLYREKMHALVDSWRKLFEVPDMPFYFVQLAPYKYNRFDGLPVFWEAQQKYADEAANAAMAVITDIGNHTDIHPRNKHDVGKRLALLALKYTYGKKVVADSPFYASHKISGGKVTVSFRNAEKLQSKDGKAIRHFEVAGKDGVFHPAKAEIIGNQVVVSSEKVAAPVMVRFGWDAGIVTNLVNEAGLPAGSFRTQK